MYAESLSVALQQNHASKKPGKKASGAMFLKVFDSRVRNSYFWPLPRLCWSGGSEGWGAQILNYRKVLGSRFLEPGFMLAWFCCNATQPACVGFLTSFGVVSCSVSFRFVPFHSVFPPLNGLLSCRSLLWESPP